MTEPVAYRASERKGDRWLLFNQKPTMNVYEVIEPLYTAEQLNPRVKMTQAEFDEWKDLHYRHVIFTAAATAIDNDAANQEHRYDNIYNRIYNDFGNSEALRNNEAIFAKLYVEFDSKNPEETIEIIPDMKWFVRSKSRDDEGDYAFLSGIKTPDDWGYSKRHDGVNEPGACAYAFDTQGEAELWVTPLTEAVQLPVEGE